MTKTQALLKYLDEHNIRYAVVPKPPFEKMLEYRPGLRFVDEVVVEPANLTTIKQKLYALEREEYNG